MELYVLDSLLRRVEVVDRFESLIWTERFAEFGDFELVIHSNATNRALLATGVRLAVNTSYRVMTIETVENTTDAEGKNLLKIKGRSIESILDDRIARPGLFGGMVGTTPSLWRVTGTPGNVIRQMFDRICIQGQLDQNDKIPFIALGNIFAQDTIPEPPFEIEHDQEVATLYEAITNLCQIYDLGFRLIRNFDHSELYFNVYTGSDRTTGQKLVPAVVFAPELDNLQNTTSLKTTENAKNAAYVISDTAAIMVYPDDVDPDVEGFERRVLLVKSDAKLSDAVTNEDGSVTPAVTEEDVISRMTQQGREELTKHRTFEAFDGEIDQSSNYVYGVHYGLGDLVEIRNSDGQANNMRVTEQIFVSDKEGDRSYPTLTLNQYINPGSWLTWNFNQVWEELGPESWSEV